MAAAKPLRRKRHHGDRWIRLRAFSDASMGALYGNR
jgi:hypothetical protein